MIIHKDKVLLCCLCVSLHRVHGNMLHYVASFSQHVILIAIYTYTSRLPIRSLHRYSIYDFRLFPSHRLHRDPSGAQRLLQMDQVLPKAGAQRFLSWMVFVWKKWWFMYVYIRANVFGWFLLGKFPTIEVDDDWGTPMTQEISEYFWVNFITTSLWPHHEWWSMGNHPLLWPQLRFLKHYSLPRCRVNKYWDQNGSSTLYHLVNQHSYGNSVLNCSINTDLINPNERLQHRTCSKTVGYLAVSPTKKKENKL